MPKHSISTLLRVPQVSPYGGGLSLSPDSRHAAVSWNRSGAWEIWLIALDGKRRPQRITAGPHAKSAPRFSPDGGKLGFLQDYDGNEQYDLFVYDLSSGQVRNAMPGTDDTLNDLFSWSPDSRHAAVVTNRAGRMAVHSLDTHTGQMRRLTHHEYSDYDGVWSPTGRHIALSALIRGQTINLFIVEAAAPEKIRVIADHNGPLDATAPRWSPDGGKLAFIGHPADNAAIGVFDLATGAVTWVAADQYDHDSPTWSSDGNHIAYTVNRDGNVSLVIADLARGRRRRVDIEPGYHVDPLFTRDGRSLICTFHSARRPADLWKLDLANGKWMQLTNSLPAAVRPGDFIPPSVIRWTSFDGLAIPGLLFEPKGRKKRRPLLLYVHGGPSWQTYNAWYPLVQAWLAEGWAVLCPNYRGSTGYGKKFQEANRYVLGQADIADIVSGADHLVRKGIADPQHIGITGASYGGYMTMVGLTRFPEKFSVGSAVVPFINWFTEFESEREDLRYWDLENMGDPNVVPERFREASPMFFLDRIQAPVQLLAGAHDPRCPANETEQAVAELRQLGKPLDVLIFPDEGHGFLKLKNRVTAYTRQLKFLKKHL